MMIAVEAGAHERHRNRHRDERYGRAGVCSPAPAGEAHHPETAHTSFFSLAASAPAAARKSSPVSRKE